MGPSDLLSIHPAREGAVLLGRKYQSVPRQHTPCALIRMEMPSGRVLPRLSKVLGMWGSALTCRQS